MISLEKANSLHGVLIKYFGGIDGTRDSSSLESALSRPFQTFDSKDLYPSVIEKSASLIESILYNHPFLDRNKRTGWALLRLFLLDNGYNIIASANDRYEFVISIASGKRRFDEIMEWLNANVVPIRS